MAVIVLLWLKELWAAGMVEKVVEVKGYVSWLTLWVTQLMVMVTIERGTPLAVWWRVEICRLWLVFAWLEVAHRPLLVWTEKG